MIIIHWDYVDGTEVSYAEGLQLKDNFNTCCLNFFSNDTRVDDVVVLKKDGSYVSRKELMSMDQLYTNKAMRQEHNLYKMLVAGSFEFKQR